MKRIFPIAIMFLALNSSLFGQLTTLEGGVKEFETGELLIGASVKILAQGLTVKSTVTDLDGKFRVSLLPGLYDIEASFTGMQTTRITKVQVLEKAANYLEPILLKSSTILNEVVIEAYKVPMIRKDMTSGGQTLTSEKISSLSTKRETKAKVKREDNKAKGSKSVDTKGSISLPTGPIIYIDGTRVTGILPIEDKPTRLEAADVEIPPTVGTTAIENYRPGQLTAGEWNDLYNWKNHFSQVYADGETAIASQNWSLYPIRRYSLILQNQEGAPLSNATIALKTKTKELLWLGKTDQTGHVDCWLKPYATEAKEKALSFYLLEGSSEFFLTDALPYSNSPQLVTLNKSCKQLQNIDIMWVVDATSSMSDEIKYLQAEINDVVERVRKNLPKAVIRNGATFYRDFSDAYVVRSQPFSSDLEQTTAFIKEQRAGGGGDKPEAVDSALTAAIFHQNWNPNALARICFLVLDASPHANPTVTANLQSAINEAAKKGIRIVPIAASGITKDTEWLMKYLAILTNGTYVFLTDDSGIGESHLEPTTEVYLVEKLNNLLVRLITEYGTQADCQGHSEVLLAKNNACANPLVWSFFPNPASTQVTFSLPDGVEQINIFNMEGKLVNSMISPKSGSLVVALDQFAVGYYLIQLKSADSLATGRLVIIRS
jgi:hypothetical protein